MAAKKKKKKGQPPNQTKSAKKRAYARKTPQARAYSKPGKVKDSAAGGAMAARALIAAARRGANRSTTKDRLEGALDTGEVATDSKRPPVNYKQRPKGHA